MPRPKTFVLLLALSAVVLSAPALAAEPVDAPEAATQEATGDARAPEQAPAEAETSPQTCETGPSFGAEPLLQASPGAASSCTARTTCFDGETISCSGDTCFSDPHCFVVCDGNIRRCNSACP